MKTILTLFIWILSIPIFAQQQLQIIDKATNFPLEFVEIQNEQYKVITTSDEEGKFIVDNNISYIVIEHPGFPPQSFDLPTPDNKIYLDSDLVHLKSIDIVANDDKSIDLIKKVIANQKNNSPTALDSYQFKSYTKLTIDANKDSITYIPHPENESDSAQNENKKMLESSMLFISERAIDHFYDRKYGKKNKVEAARIAGLKTPLYEVMALQPLSYEFNEDYFNFFFRKFPNPISTFGMKGYNFSIVDTVQQGELSLIKVNFSAKKKEKKSIHGYLMIEQNSYALSKFFAENETKAGSDTYIEVVYKPFKQIWKPAHQVFKLEADNFKYQVVEDSIGPKGDTIRKRIDKKTKTWLNAQTTFSGFKSPVTPDKKVFKGYENQIDKASFKQFENTIPAYRIDPLNDREKGTYQKIDSIGKAEKLDRNIKLIRIFTQQGWYSFWKLKVNLLDVFNFNDYEDYRIGANLKTNSSFSQKFGLNGRLYYGTGDKEFKYGLGAWLNVNANTNAQIFVDYADDITASGRFHNPTADFRRDFDFRTEQSANPKYVEQVKQTLGYRQDLFENVNVEISANVAEEKSLFDYSFKGYAMDKTYQNNFVKVALRYAPKEKHIQTPLGKFTYNRGLPNYYLMVDQGLDVLDGDMDYTRIQFMTQQQVRLFTAPTIFNFRAGKVFGEAPIWQYFDGPGKAKDRTNFWPRARFGGSAIFETMAQGEFISDQFVYGSVKQRFARIKIGDKVNIPVNVLYKVGYGTLDNKENHHYLTYQEMDDVYQEVGVEFDNILFNFVGLGFYYRLGAYNQDDFATDFSMKAVLNFSFF